MLRRSFIFIVWLVCPSVLVACSLDRPASTQPPQEPATAARVEPAPTVAEATPVAMAATCADIDANWGQNWPAVLDTLEQLIEADQTCGEEPLLSKKYAVHFNYGAALEASGELTQAIEQYQAALFIDPQRQEALQALLRLKALPKPTPPACLSTSSPRPDPALAKTPDPSLFIQAQADQLQLNGQPFQVKGVNYYPRHAPWASFLTAAQPSAMAEELDVIKEAGFNTLRIFLWYQPLFTCQPEDAIPNEAAFAVVDTLFQLARERDLKLIVTLNDLPDLVFRPLYTDWPHYDAQTIYIVRRYRHEPSLLAWDVRNGGDFDYNGDEAQFSQAEVMAWLAHLTGLIREHDPYHLLTAGWWGDPADTAPYVDILSFQHWAKTAELQTRLETYQAQSDKPLLLEALGYHSWAEAAAEPRDEADQADLLAEGVQVAEAASISGWLIWTAFDFVPGPGQPVTDEHFFGLWRTDLTPKPALEVLPLL